MKKLIVLAFIGVAAFSSLKAQDAEKNESKAIQKVESAGRKVKKGAKHGYYDATHNKVTKKTDINEGNQKYSKKEDITADTKAERGLEEGGRKVKQGAKHGYYDATHNKVTKKTDINEGNRKYKNQDDLH